MTPQLDPCCSVSHLKRCTSELGLLTPVPIQCGVPGSVCTRLISVFSLHPVFVGEKKNLFCLPTVSKGNLGENSSIFFLLRCENKLQIVQKREREKTVGRFLRKAEGFGILAFGLHPAPLACRCSQGRHGCAPSQTALDRARALGAASGPGWRVQGGGLGGPSPSLAPLSFAAAGP